MGFPNYNNGDRWCARCYEWVLAKDIPKATHKNKNGMLLHECGYRIREQPRRTIEQVRNTAARHKPIKIGHTIREDIIKNRERLNRIILGTK